MGPLSWKKMKTGSKLVLKLGSLNFHEKKNFTVILTVNHQIKLEGKKKRNSKILMILNSRRICL